MKRNKKTLEQRYEETCIKERNRNGKWINLDFPNDVVKSKKKYNRKTKHKKDNWY